MRSKKDVYTYLNLAEEVLSNVKQPLTISQIWNNAEKAELIAKLNSVGKTPIKTLQARLYIDIRDNENSIFVQTSKRPSMFYLKNMEQNNNIEEKLDVVEEHYNERDLHKLLSTYVNAAPEFRCKTKTIFHEKTLKSKKGLNQWLHPDIIGVYFPFSDYQGETIELQKILADEQYKLYSFEMKITLNLSNLREYYFQAVSNSSWAHEGYIVALNIDQDESFLLELKRLNNAFGIGVIKLNPENISQSEILFSAKTHDVLDWDTIDRLMDNPDFADFSKDFRDDADDGRIRGQYDEVFDDDETAAEYARKKKMIL